MSGSERRTLFADVILPLAVPQYYTYRIPLEMNEDVLPGMRAIVQFGKNKLYTAIVRNVHQTAPRHYEAKYLDGILDERPIVTEQQMTFWEWMADYYCCTPGEVFLAAVPGSLRLGSETVIVPDPDSQTDFPLSPKEQTILDALELGHKMTLLEIAELLGQRTVQQHVKSLLEKKKILVEEELKYRYRPKYETMIELSAACTDEDALREVFAQLEKDKRAQKRVDALLQFIQLSGRYSTDPKSVKKSELVKALGGNSSPIDTLIKAGVFEIRQVRVDRLAPEKSATSTLPVLSDEQQRAFDEISKGFNENKPVLLHGVTGSGKTEIYIRLIQEILEKTDGQVLYLLPEIALTTQIIQRLRRFFGDMVGIYHSRFNDQERAEIWAKTLKGEYRILLGARSSVFLPFTNLKMIIVDEEHENTFKQFDPAPRYHARDAGIVLAARNNAKILLGSATPSIESYHNADTGKYVLVELKKRFGGILLPEIQCVDIKQAHKRKEMHSSFSHDLLEHIKVALGNKEQIILFQNRRGYTPQWNCETCSWVPRCKNCDVSLTYHKSTHQLICHYCATAYPPPKTCSACGSHKLKMVGFGTEKIEEDLELLIPGIRIQRLDLDSTRTKNAYVQILTDFEERNIDVLVGTQMVTKGLDFDNVALVGILNADTMLNFPDFRAFERSYQLLSQVAGRAGRKGKRGKVLIQTWEPNHWVIQKVMQNDYIGMYKQEIIERKNFHYPPFIKLIKITLRNKDKTKVDEAAIKLASALKKVMGTRVLGPEEPSIPRIRNYFYRTILLKIERGATYPQWKKQLMEWLLEFRKEYDKTRTLIDLDVDPF